MLPTIIKIPSLIRKKETLYLNEYRLETAIKTNDLMDEEGIFYACRVAAKSRLRVVEGIAYSPESLIRTLSKEKSPFRW